MTKEQVYQKQMEELGIWKEIFLPELRTLCRCERELTRAEKAWSRTAPPGGKPSFLDDHFPVIQKLRVEILQHREALGLTPKALRKLTGAEGAAGPDQQELITEKLDRIAERVAGYDSGGAVPTGPAPTRGGDGTETILPPVDVRDSYGGIELAAEAAAISEMMDEELRRAVHEDMG